MSTILQNPTQESLHTLLADIVGARILKKLQASRPGHCLRISALPEEVMRRLCVQFQDSEVGADVVLLLGPHQQPQAPWQVTATRLIELRNAEQRPLLAFVPPGLKAAAEDSFDVSTFVELNLGNVSSELRHQLRSKLPTELQRLTDTVIEYMEKSARQIGDNDITRYYQTILQNGATHTAAGGGIFHFNLVPDFALLNIPDRIKQRVDRNASAINILNDGLMNVLGRIHALKLKENSIQASLYDFLRQHILSPVTEWGMMIATDPRFRELSFDKWIFADEERSRESLLLYVADLNLPTKDEKQSGPDNPPYLDLDRAKSVRIQWETNPKPATVDGLVYFRIELVNSDEVVVWESKNIKNTNSTKAFRAKIVKIEEFRNAIGGEEGIYFFRVRAYSEAGDILNREDAENYPEILRDPRNPDGKRINESDDVWLWIDEDNPPPVEAQRNTTAASFLDAQLQAQFAMIERSENPFNKKLIPQERNGWAKINPKRPEVTYSIIYDTQARYTLNLNTLLLYVERTTLKEAHQLGRWRLDFRDGLTTHYSVKLTPRQFRSQTQVPPAFMQARQAVFAAILGQEENITSTVDLLQIKDLIVVYAQAYQQWLMQVQANFESGTVYDENQHRLADPVFLDLDTVELLLPNDERVYLAAPTHPLRLLWQLQWSQVSQAWVETAVATDTVQIYLTPPIKQRLRSGLLPINLPPLLLLAQEESPPRFYLEQGVLTPFWSLYMGNHVRDKQTVQAQVRRLLGMGYQNAIQTVNAKTLAQKLQHYLVQHPYAQVLKINAFNPGSAETLVSAILVVEKERQKGPLPVIRYEIRLFTESGQVDQIGEAVADLLNPDRQVSAEADAFAVASKNHLFPKLRFSRNTLDDFLENPERYEAHISMLHDLFPVDVALTLPGKGRSSFVHGLIQDQVTDFDSSEAQYAWRRQLLPEPCVELPDDDGETSSLIANLLSRIGALQASATTGRYVEQMAPALQLTLPIDKKGLLYQVHIVSDWVFIIDRYLGLDYFDSETGPGRPVYLLDFTPEFGNAATERLLLTTRSTEEIIRLVRPALDKFNLLEDGNVVEVFFLQLLRSLSGRLALKLLSSSNQVNKALGLASARLFLEQYDLLENCIVIPLDAHNGLFAGDHALEDNQVSLQRDDLLLVAFHPEDRAIHFHMIEVRWHSHFEDFFGYQTLKQDIEKQTDSTKESLCQHFDPHFHAIDRIDRQLKTRELIALLNFYLARAKRFNLIRADIALRLHEFINSLDQGYKVVFAGSGLVFDFSYRGLDVEEERSDLIFYRVGSDYIRQLLDNGLRRQSLLRTLAETEPTTTEETEQHKANKQRIIEETSMRRDTFYDHTRAYFPLSTIENAPAPTPRQLHTPAVIQTTTVPVSTPEAEVQAPQATTTHILPVSTPRSQTYHMSKQLEQNLIKGNTATTNKIREFVTSIFLEQFHLSFGHIVLQQGNSLIVASCDANAAALRLDIFATSWKLVPSQLGEPKNIYRDLAYQLQDAQVHIFQYFNRQGADGQPFEVIKQLAPHKGDFNHRLMTSAERKESIDRIKALATGFALQVHLHGIIVDFTQTGISFNQIDGIRICHVGIDYLERFVSNVRQWHESLKSDRSLSIRKKLWLDHSMLRDTSYVQLQAFFDLYPWLTPSKQPMQPPSEPSLSHPPYVAVTKDARLEVKETTPQKATQVAPMLTNAEQPNPKPVAPMPPKVEQKLKQQENDALKSHSQPVCDILLGLDDMKLQQFGIIGKSSGRFVGLDLNGTNTISLFGVQGGGKSYTIGTIAEMAAQALPGINHVPSPLATVIFHYHESQDYAPEFVSMNAPNSKDEELNNLLSEYNAHPAALEDVLLLTSPGKVSQRQAEFPSIQVEPIYFGSNELAIKDWRFLMGAGGNQMYMKQINLIMRQLRGEITLQSLRDEIEKSGLNESQKAITRVRLNFAAEFINDEYCLANKLKPGRLIIVDVRDEYVEKDEALGLFVVMLNIFANAGKDTGFNKLIVFDEAHKYMDNADLTSHIVEVIRQMRHQGVSLIIASQDPPSLPNEIIELSSLVILHRFNSPQWLKHVQKSITALGELTPAQMAALRPGDAYVWANKSTERVFTQKAVKIRLRPRATQHGGGTKTAL